MRKDFKVEAEGQNQQIIISLIARVLGEEDK